MSTLKKPTGIKNDALTRFVLLKYTEDFRGRPEGEERYPGYSDVRELYNDGEDYDAVERAIVSIYNAILVQRRKVLILTRDSIIALLKNDPNWQKKTGFRLNRWRELIALLTNPDSPILRKIYRDDEFDHRRYDNHYEVVDDALLRFLEVDFQAQKQECQSISDAWHQVSAKADENNREHNREHNPEHRRKKEELSTKKKELRTKKERIKSSCSNVNVSTMPAPRQVEAQQQPGKNFSERQVHPAELMEAHYQDQDPPDHWESLCKHYGISSPSQKRMLKILRANLESIDQLAEWLEAVTKSAKRKGLTKIEATSYMASAIMQEVKATERGE